MRLLAAAFVALSFAGIARADGATERGRAGSVTVHGRALRAGSWCGGAATTPQMMERYKPRPTTARFEVLPGKTGSSAAPVVTFNPDANGEFSLSLPPGDYCVMEPGKTDKPKANYGQWVDAACMATWKKTCSVVWHVESKDTNVTFTLSDPCFGPCYRGPWPP